MRGSSSTSLNALAAAGLLIVTSNQAAARIDDNDELQRVAASEAIVVTGLSEGTGAGTKTDTPLIETPQSITVIDARELERRNALSINQALGYVAGVAANQRGGTVTRYDQLLLRGFAPGIFLDGMRLLAGPYSMPQIDFNRVEQVDIVKGPASVLYGNATPGGLVNLTSKLPTAQASGRAELQVGNYDTVRAVADVNQPLTSDGKLLARIVGGWQKGDGFTRDTFSERYHISPMLTFAPDDATSITLIAAYQHSPSGGGYSGVPAYGSVLPSPAGEIPLHINTGDPGYERYNHKAKSVALLLRHDFNGNLSFRSNTRFQNNELRYRQIYVAGYLTTGTGLATNTDYANIRRGGGGADEDFDTFTIDNHFNAKFATGPFEHNVLVGLDYQHIAGENVQQFNTGPNANPALSIPDLNLFNPVYGVSLPTTDLRALSAAYVNTFSKRDQVGVYVQDQVAIGGLRLIASGRWDWYDQTTINKKLPANNVTLLSQTAFTGRLGALYETEFGVSPYISYSESFEPQAGATYLGVPFEPVTGKMLEAGIKFQPRGANALFTLSAYELKRQNVPAPDPLAGTGGRPPNAQVQIGEVRVRGIELEGRGELSPGFDVILAAAYTDSFITQGSPAIAPVTATPTVRGTNGTPATTNTPSLGTPEWQATGFLSYDLGRAGVSGPAAGLSLGAGVRYVSGSWGSTNYKVVNNVTTFEAFETEAFTLVDAVIGYDLSRLGSGLAGWSAAVNASNLLNKRYISACPFSNSCYFGGSRTVTGSLRFKW